MIQAIIASMGYAGGVAIDKILLSREKIKVRVFIPVLFALLCFFTIFLMPSYGSINHEFFSLKYLFIFVLMIIAAVSWNQLYYTGIQKESLHEFELIMLLSPLATIIFAMIFLPHERNFAVFLAGIIASVAFMWSRLKSHHIAVSKTAKGTMIAMLLISFESVLIRYMLDVMSPVSLYFFRTLIIAVVTYIKYQPKLFEVKGRFLGLASLSALFGVIQMVLKFYGFRDLGVIETTMILLLGPFLVYLFSYFYFHERAHSRKDMLCASVVILCIIYSTLVG